ncbi:MAG: hypothetical protein M1812_005411 [Candelaria pacifica]|nr:MAG: hypothetical protein M1812_005411 [Candelaria pacifica]
MHHRLLGLLCLLPTPSYSSPTWKVDSLVHGNLDIRQPAGGNTDGGSLGSSSSSGTDGITPDVGNDTGNGMAGTSGALTGTLIDFNAPSSGGLSQSNEMNFAPGTVVPVSAPSPPSCISAGQLVASCWDALNMDQYVSQWWQINKGLCQPQGLTFAPCFLKKTLDQDIRCNSTNDGCHFHFYELSAYSPSDAYLLYSIYELWSWFGNFKGYLQAGLLEVGSTSVGDEISKINSQFGSAPFPTGTPNYVTNAFLAGVLDLPLPSGVQLRSILPGSPDIAKTLVTPGSSTIDLNEPRSFDAMMADYVPQLDSALDLIQNDVEEFLAMTAHGAFVGPQSGTLPPRRTLWTYVFTYVTSLSLQANNIAITVSHNTDPRVYHQYGWDAGLPLACDHMEQHGICSAWWHDNTTNSTYSLTNMSPGGSHQNYHNAMQFLFSNYTSGELLFLGAEGCVQYGPGAGPNISANLQLSCMSNTAVCEFNPKCMGAACEFTNCNTQPDWTNPHCPDDDNDDISQMPGLDLPVTYIGDLLGLTGDSYHVCRGPESFAHFTHCIQGASCNPI